MLVVVLIIGILAAVALPQYQKAVFKTRATEAVLMASNVQKAVDAYILEHGWGTEYQDITDELDITVPASTCFNPNAIAFEYNNASDYYYIAIINGPQACSNFLQLVVEKYPGENAWRKTCDYGENTPAENFCRELEKQGWTSAAW